jgi:hypothetical protein
MENKIKLEFKAYPDSVDIHFRDDTFTCKTKFAASVMLASIAHTHFGRSLEEQKEVLQKIDLINRESNLLRGHTEQAVPQAWNHLKKHGKTHTAYQNIHERWQIVLTHQPTFSLVFGVNGEKYGELRLPCGILLTGQTIADISIPLQQIVELRLVTETELMKFRDLMQLCQMPLNLPEHN